MVGTFIYLFCLATMSQDVGLVVPYTKVAFMKSLVELSKEAVCIRAYFLSSRVTDRVAGRVISGLESGNFFDFAAFSRWVKY